MPRATLSTVSISPSPAREIRDRKPAFSRVGGGGGAGSPFSSGSSSDARRGDVELELCRLKAELAREKEARALIQRQVDDQSLEREFWIQEKAGETAKIKQQLTRALHDKDEVLSKLKDIERDYAELWNTARDLERKNASLAELLKTSIPSTSKSLSLSTSLSNGFFPENSSVLSHGSDAAGGSRINDFLRASAPGKVLATGGRRLAPPRGCLTTLHEGDYSQLSMDSADTPPPPTSQQNELRLSADTAAALIRQARGELRDQVALRKSEKDNPLDVGSVRRLRSSPILVGEAGATELDMSDDDVRTRKDMPGPSMADTLELCPEEYEDMGMLFGRGSDGGSNSPKGSSVEGDDSHPRVEQVVDSDAREEAGQADGTWARWWSSPPAWSGFASSSSRKPYGRRHSRPRRSDRVRVQVPQPSRRFMVYPSPARPNGRVRTGTICPRSSPEMAAKKTSTTEYLLSEHLSVEEMQENKILHMSPIEWFVECPFGTLSQAGVSAGEQSEEDIGCVSLAWAPTVVDFLNTVDPEKGWTRDMVEFVYCYWSQKFDEDDKVPVKPGDYLSLTAGDLGLSKHRTMDVWATAEVISAEETTTISRQKKMKSQTIRCRLADKSLYDMIVKKRPDMRGKDGILVRENFLYEKREGARASVYLELKEKIKENLNSPTVSAAESPISEGSPASPGVAQRRPSVKVAAEDSIESRVRRSSRHQRGTRLTPSELAKIIQASQLKDTSAYGRYYNEQRLREEGGGPPEPPPTPVSPEPLKVHARVLLAANPWRDALVVKDSPDPSVSLDNSYLRKVENITFLQHQQLSSPFTAVAAMSWLA
ncbi:hypothetical protein FOZ62_027019 [Perkinsus olseni]|uniref:Uncharacterized protein n=1 Tax=Perkinsus olseni TaxID=32597 RepID=A0A7J6T165_PEROL|nr:hypothetical protein FOZ62_027019 [Perkinsus olseni]